MNKPGTGLMKTITMNKVHENRPHKKRQFCWTDKPSVGLPVVLLFLWTYVFTCGWCLPAAVAQADIAIGRIEAPVETPALVPVIYTAPDDNSPATLVLKFVYQAAVLDVSSVSAGPVLAQYDKTLDYEVREGTVAIAVFGGIEAVPSGVIAYLHVQVKPDVETGSVLLVLNAASEGADRHVGLVDVMVQNGNVRVIEMPEKHDADTDPDWRISLEELLRVIQFYNAGEYHCDEAGEDGYETGSGVQDCIPHDVDYSPADWRISFSELLRIIQIYNAPFQMYHVNPDSEDGFAPGPFGYER